jgi:hypothetical protein
MRPTLLILIVIAAGLLAWRFLLSPPTSAPTPATADRESPDSEDAVPEDQATVTPEWELPPPPGTTPREPAQLEIRHEVRMQGPQTRLHLFLSEKHGWYVDQIYVAFWYQEKDPKTGELKKYGERSEFIPKVIRYGQSIEHEFVIYVTDVPAGKDKGTTENWGVRVIQWAEDRVRAPLSK